MYHFNKKLLFMFTTIVFFIFSVEKGFCQKFKKLEVQNVPGFIEAANERNLVTSYVAKNEFVKVEDFLPKNYVKDGSADYTSFIQKVLNENRNVIFPGFPLLIKDVGLAVSNGSTIVFSKGSTLHLMPSAKSNYEMLRIHGKNNVKIVNPTLVGDRDIHTGNKGEWGMGISIKDSENIKIINPKISNFWGDGIYLGKSKKVNKNISISGGKIDNSRRNGISVVAVDGLLIEKIIVSNTNGVSPQVGIDFEPNSNNDLLRDIVIKDTYLFNNKFTGLFFNTTNMFGSDQLVGVHISNVVNEKSQYTVGYSSPKKKPNSRDLKGKIEIQNLSSKNIQKEVQIFGTSSLDKVNISVDKRALKR